MNVVQATREEIMLIPLRGIDRHPAVGDPAEKENIATQA